MKTQRKIKVNIFISSILMIIVFAVMLKICIHQQILNNSGVAVNATVVSVESTQNNIRGSAIYKDESGSEHIFKGFLGQNVKVGSQITVYYDKDNPDDAVVPNQGIITGTIVSGIFCALLILCSIHTLLFDKSDRQPACGHIEVNDKQLAEIVQECLPQTKLKFAEKREKNKRIDLLGTDRAIMRAISNGDSIKGIYDNQKSIMAKGNIYPCAVIRPFSDDIYNQMLPLNDERYESEIARYTVMAFVVYSTDDYFISHPNELKHIANKFMYQSYGSEIVNENDRMYFNAVHDNNARLYNVQYNGALSNNRNVFITTVILDKTHLCNARLSNKLLYIVANPAETEYSVILPAWYYSKQELSAF